MDLSILTKQYGPLKGWEWGTAILAAGVTIYTAVKKRAQSSAQQQPAAAAATQQQVPLPISGGGGDYSGGGFSSAMFVCPDGSVQGSPTQCSGSSGTGAPAGPTGTNGLIAPPGQTPYSTNNGTVFLPTGSQYNQNVVQALNAPAGDTYLPGVGDVPLYNNPVEYTLDPSTGLYSETGTITPTPATATQQQLFQAGGFNAPVYQYNPTTVK